MKDKIVKLLKTHLASLEEPDFDLEAWKSAVLSVLSKFFGPDDPKIKQIESLKIDYSSWALRDSNSSYNPKETCKRKGKSILESAINEAEIIGFPGDKEAPSLLDKLKIAVDAKDYKELTKSSTSKTKALKSYKKEKLVAILDKLID